MQFRARAVRLLILMPVLFPVRALAESAESTTGDARLVVVIVVDQLRADFVDRFAMHFGKGGFELLKRRGAHFVNAYFSFGSSATGPGHAAISTGRLPRQHGIVGNKWFLEPGVSRGQAAVHDARSRVVGREGSHAGAPSPGMLIGPTLGDQLKMSDRRCRVFCVALKDRASVLTGGAGADGAFWWDSSLGGFVTSDFYSAALPDYVAEFNSSRWADRFAGTGWKPCLPQDAYAGCIPTRTEWLRSDYGLGAVFPHKMPDEAGEPLYEAVKAAPFGNEIVLEMAERIIRNEGLGRGKCVDLLWIGLSSNDYCGHVFGPESPEVMDLTVRTDGQLASFFDLLDKEVGLGRCILALTADHGVTSPPQVAKAAGLGGGLLDMVALQAELNRVLRESVGTLENGRAYVTGINLPWVYFDRSFDGLDATTKKRAYETATALLRRTEGVAEVFTAPELAGPSPRPRDAARYLAWRCFHPERSGELYVQLKPYWKKSDENFAGHTAGFSHDRHVPILLAGPGVRSGRYFGPADPMDIPVTIAAMLGIEAPLEAEGRVLHEALREAPDR